ncbi:MAG: hypothetical protein M1815_002283 [Lichina confinis]|nr:MAG: hypothetical protein M1815_002283 [Lichina confinis]
MEGSIDLLNVFPNPLVEPTVEMARMPTQGLMYDRPAELDILVKGPRQWMIGRFEVSRVIYFRPDGGQALASPPSRQQRVTGNAPSLVELCLRALSTTSSPVDLTEL